jgi:protein farnesyltransferase/geranylgeranyltransferase type-1 subunit alpha
MDLFRAVMKSGELSERALQLTEELLDENPGGYTVWQYRRECLRALGADLEEELDFMDKFADDNPKNYQIWHHRRTIVDMHNSGDRELQFTAEVFAVDAKNYHAWAHRFVISSITRGYPSFIDNFDSFI